MSLAPLLREISLAGDAIYCSVDLRCSKTRFAPLIMEVLAGLCWYFFYYVVLNMRTKIKRFELELELVKNS